MRLLPTVALEPPDGYVAFVAAHLEPLRAEAAGVAGGADEAERLYPAVLTDVAARWRWLELLRRGLRRPHAADSYLRRAFARRLRRWRAGWDRMDDVGPEIEVWTPELIWTARPARPVRSSGAARIAAFVRPTHSERAVLAEAAVAWWHAYEARRRRRLVAVAVVVLLLVLLLLHMHQPPPT